jgi:uncharacterized protein (TIGR02444 family)
MTAASEIPRDSAFWRFSLRFYALPGVAAACLALQDEAGADVNLLLFLLFLADGGRAVSGDDVARLDASIAPWRSEVVEPLRALRRRLKTGIGAVPPALSEGLRTMVKKVELEAERLEQGRLENHTLSLGKPAARAAAARTNLDAYAAYLGHLPAGPRDLVLAAFSAPES